jgi:hypothetical protein
MRSRPCVRVSCKHTAYLDVNEETGSVKLNFPDLEPGDMPAAVRDGITLEEVGAAMNLTRERVRQYETRSLERLRPLMPNEAFEDGALLHPVGGHAGAGLVRRGRSL